MITVRRAFPLPLSERSAMNVGVQKAFTDPMGTILYYAANGDWTHGKHLSKISRLYWRHLRVPLPLCIVEICPRAS
jgi:hypothetical protein